MKTILIFLFVTVSLYSNGQTLVFDKDSLHKDKPSIMAIPDSRGFINDREHVYTPNEIKQLKSYMLSQKMDSTQITVLTITELDPFNSLEELATSYANLWQLGGKKKNGVMLIFSKKLKQSRVQVGESLESKFTDEALKSIDNVMIPEFVKGNYYSGTLKALQRINQLLKQK